MDRFNKFLDQLSEYFANRKGLLPITGILLIITNFVLQFFPDLGWVGQSNLLLHVGVVLAIFGFLLARAL